MSAHHIHIPSVNSALRPSLTVTATLIKTTISVPLWGISVPFQGAEVYPLLPFHYDIWLILVSPGSVMTTLYYSMRREGP